MSSRRQICSFAVFFSVSRPFFRFTGTSGCVTRRNQSSQIVRVMANRSQVMISAVLSACRFVESATICHVLVHCFGLQVSRYLFAFQRQNMTFIVNVLPTFKIVTQGSSVIRTAYKYSGQILITGIIFILVSFSSEMPQLYFAKAIAFKFFCLLQLSDRAYVSGARCIVLFLHRSFWYHRIQMQLFMHKSVDCVACCICHCLAYFTIPNVSQNLFKAACSCLRFRLRYC